MTKPLKKSQIKKLNKTFKPKFEREIVLILQDVTDPVNVGGLFRVADGTGVSEIILTGKTPKPSDPRVSMVSRGLERRIEYHYAEKCIDVITEFREKGFSILALELTEESKLYSEYEYSKKIALILGNEALGVYKNILLACDDSIHIPMLGKGPSLNVHVAAAVALYEIIVH